MIYLGYISQLIILLQPSKKNKRAIFLIELNCDFQVCLASLTTVSDVEEVKWRQSEKGSAMISLSFASNIPDVSGRPLLTLVIVESLKWFLSYIIFNLNI